jgi:DNA-binding winged helix-turn-helix (wHTH) protein
MGLLNFGTLQIDLEQRRVFTASSEIIVEPKMFEVLSYLIKNSERYVSLQELHTEVWAGRVVTDTAVRRVISKLRVHLGDTDPETPIYIKSQMKRGYQFIGQPLPEASTTADFAEIKPEIPVTKALQSLKFWGLVLVIALMMGFAVSLYWSVRSSTSAITTEPLVNISGEKHFLSVSENGRYQVFTGRLDKNEGWQAYFFDSQLAQLQKIDRTEKGEFPFVAILKNEKVVMTSFVNGKAKLHLYQISDLTRPFKTIEFDEFSRIAQVAYFQDDLILMSGQKKEEKNFVYYQLDLKGEQLKQFTFSSLQQSIDFHITFSPDKKHFAFIRRGADFQVQVINAAKKTLLATDSFDLKATAADELNLLWLDNDQLLINAGEKFNVLNINNGSKKEPSVTQRFSGLARGQQGNFYGLQKPAQLKTFFQVQLSNLGSKQRYFSFTGHTHSLNFSKIPNQLWLVEKNDADYQLYLYQPETGNKRFYFKSKEPFTVISEDPDMALLLLFNNKQIKLLDHNRETLIDISDVNQKIGFSTFSQTNGEVLFTEKIGDTWHVQSFDVKTKLQKRLLKGFRMLLPWQQQFIAADEKGQFYLLDDQFQVVKQLPFTIDFNFLYQVSLHGNKIISANIGSDSTWKLATLDLITEQYQQQSLHDLPINSKFSFNNDGTESIVSTANDDGNQLVRLSYNFGYN